MFVLLLDLLAVVTSIGLQNEFIGSVVQFLNTLWKGYSRMIYISLRSVY